MDSVWPSSVAMLNIKDSRTYPESDVLVLLDDLAGGVDMALGFEGVRFGPRLLVVMNGVRVSEHPGPLREVVPVVMRIDNDLAYTSY